MNIEPHGTYFPGFRELSLFERLTNSHGFAPQGVSSLVSYTETFTSKQGKKKPTFMV